VDIRDDTGDSIVEHVAGVDDFEVAEATYRAVARWPSARITLRQGIRVGTTRGDAPALLPICLTVPEPTFSPIGIYGISRREDHSGLMLAARTTLAHFSVSSAMSLPKSAGEP
jgi:hypothetical protein